MEQPPFLTHYLVLHPLSEVVEQDKVAFANQFKPGHLKNGLLAYYRKWSIRSKAKARKQTLTGFCTKAG